MIKLEILGAIADETNAYEIATELSEYASDIDDPLARAAVKAVGKIALEVSPPPPLPSPAPLSLPCPPLPPLPPPLPPPLLLPWSCLCFHNESHAFLGDCQ